MLIGVVAAARYNLCVAHLHNIILVLEDINSKKYLVFKSEFYLFLKGFICISHNQYVSWNLLKSITAVPSSVS